MTLVEPCASLLSLDPAKAPRPVNTSPELLNTVEAAAFLRLSPATLITWRSRRRGPTYSKIGGRVVYSRDDLLAYAYANIQTHPKDPA